MSQPEDSGALLTARLAARTAHDLNNVAAVFSGHLYLLRNDAEPPQEAYDAMEKALSHLDRLTRGLTVLGTLGVEEATTVDLHEVIRAAAKSVGATIELAPALPSLRVRHPDLQLALQALLANAREAAGPDAPVHVRTRIDGNSVAVTIEDSGPGVPRAVRQRNFDPFFSTKGEKGRGIGLSIASLVAILHGGRLAVEDRPEGGTRVSLVLPARDLAQA